MQAPEYVPPWLFSGWAGLGRTTLVGVLAYLALVILLRVSGKRTLSKMNAFDLVVTVALGSTLASILTSQSVALAEGLVAFAVLIGLQFVVAWASSRSTGISRIVKSEPTLLVYRGELLVDALRRERVARDEVLAALRRQGAPALDAVEAVVLETDGSFSVIRASGRGPTSVLDRMRRRADLPE
jgi:uncharacterized membrane protein YcaP (DUF421 family)